MATKKRTDDTTTGGQDQAAEQITTGADQDTAAERDAPRVLATSAATVPAPAPLNATDRPVQARVPYPHTALVIPGGGWEAPGQARGDLVITREWTPIPPDQVDRVKQTAIRAGIKLAMLIPDDSQEG